jgi:ATP synthase protein I
VFSVSPDAPPKRILGAFYRGEAIKIGATVLMLVILLQWFSTTPLPLLTTYILAILLYWPALLVGVGRRPR